MSYSSPRCLDVACVNERWDSFTGHTHAFIHKWNEPYLFYSQPQSIPHWPVLISHPAEGRKLSWHGRLVTHRLTEVVYSPEDGHPSQY